ncbi:hypothetical protein R1sor_007053 [Riccia sorocarpa]|uniref:Auxin efflux carrier component n=1 Tax=Riccia sorocarpa TaxID=122646 RepID=A0ABD3HSV0_9MARC
MITAQDFYNVLSAVIPLYVAMILAYGSVRWWGILTPEQCGGINRFVAVFAVPLLSFKFIALNNPYTMNYQFIAADAISKIVILFFLGLWARYTKRGSFDWMITIFMLATLPNTLVMGIPLLHAMYGAEAGSLVVQAVVLQCIIWYTMLLFLYEFRAAKSLIMEQFPDTAASIVSFKVDSDVTSLDGKEPVQTEAEVGDDGKLHVKVRKSVSSSQGISSRRSQGLLSMPSSKALTPRPSNLTGAEIYSLHSSVNLTPRESSFNHTDFYSMISGRGGSPRRSNLTSSDVYSLQSSRGPTPRTSNFNEENSKDLDGHGRGASPRRFPPPIFHGPGHVFGRSHGIGGAYGGYPGSNVGVYSPTPSHMAKKIAVDPRTSPKLEDDAAKELHMFVWSSSASPVSETGRAVFGNQEVNQDEASRAQDTEAKEVRLLVLPPSDTSPTTLPANVSPAVSHSPPVSTSAPAEHRSATPELTRQNYDEYVREDFSFGYSKGLAKDDDEDKDGPSLSKKFGSSSTAELTPKMPGDRRNPNMPPPRVMIKLILDMVFRKLVRNPNTYSSLFGLTWALISFKWHVKMPKLIDNSISILSDAGLGMAMFSLGLFMALQGRLIVCGYPMASVSAALRFLLSPAAMAAASAAVGLKGNLLRASIVQAALSQGIVPFVFAKEYNLHPDILSTSVIFGMIIALPITLLYYVLLAVGNFPMRV